MSSLEIEDVLASIRRLVSDDLRPANRPNPVGKLMLTPALRVVPPAGVVNATDAPLDRPPQTVVPDAVAKPARATLRDGWVPDRTTLAAMGAEDADHLDFGGMGADAPQRSAAGPSALQTAAEGFHAETDEFILSYSDTGTVMLHTDVAPVPPEPTDHGAVFAVLHNGQGPVRVPPVQALVDAEGGAPVEDETGWSTVAWDDAPAAADPAAQATAQVLAHDDTAAQGPLILPFVSARRAPAGDVLTLRSPVLHVMTPVADRTAEDAPTEALILKRGRPRMTANHLAAQDQAAAQADTVPAEGAAAPSGDDLAAATAGHATTGATSAQTALGAASDSAGSSVGPGEEGQADATPEMAPEAVAISDGPVADLAGTALAATAGPVADAGAIAADAKAGTVAQDGTDAAAFGHLPATAAMAAPATRVRGKAAMAEAAVIDTLAETLKSAGSRGKPPATLADAAFTRWPGWAQSGAGPQPDSPPPSSPETPAVAAQGRKPKAAAQDLGWADRAEAEIHRQLAAELGPSVIRDVAAPAPGLQLSEAALRDLVRDMIREELTGKLGERITQNVRKLVQMELQKTLSLNAGEFRSQRRDPG